MAAPQRRSEFFERRLAAGAGDAGAPVTYTAPTVAEAFTEGQSQDIADAVEAIITALKARGIIL